MEASRPPILIVREPVRSALVGQYARAWFGDMVKVVVDTGRRLVAVGGEFHADGEEILLRDGSAQAELWGANVYPFRDARDRLEYTALINIRPAQGNRSMEVQDPETRRTMRQILDHLLPCGGDP